MARPIRFHPDAIGEAGAAREWYEARNPATARAFIVELDHAVDQIAEFPDRWPAYLVKTRRFVLRRFPFSMIYRRSVNGLEVVAVAHARRRPGYWKART